MALLTAIDLRQLAMGLEALDKLFSDDGPTVVPTRACLEWIGAVGDPDGKPICAHYDPEMGSWAVEVCKVES